MLHDPEGTSDVTGLLARATMVLVPYCAKPAWCRWRHREGCSECGLCEVGEAYRLARERGMAITTITNYEHLVGTLRDMKARSVEAYVGMCCGNFFVKRQRAFAEAGIPAVLMDVSGANCYELKQEEDAYAGTFRAEAKIDRDLLERVIALVPHTATDARVERSR
jgi:lipoate-protein ligase A